MATIALEHPDHPGRSGRVRCQLVVVDGLDMGRAVALGPRPPNTSEMDYDDDA